MVQMQRTVLAFASAALAGLLACGVLLLAVRTPSVAAEKPNVLFVLVDDAHISMLNRIPAVREKLVEQGTTYRNTVSNNPLCCPGRVALLRGQYPHNHLVPGNNGPAFFENGYQRNNLPTWLNNQANYKTALFGKYLNNYGGKTVPLGWDRWYAWNGPQMGWSSVNNQGRTSTISPKDADALLSNNALRFLENTPRSQPFFVWAGFGAPHRPYHHAPSTEDRFAGVQVPRTPAYNEADVSDKPPYVRQKPLLSKDDKVRLNTNYRNGLRGLLGVSAFLDKAIVTLRERHMLGNTYIVFYSDNANHFGEHRLAYGKSLPYETDINFPFVVRGPGVPRGAKSTNLVANQDFAPTVANLAGVSVPTFVDGRSFRSLLSNPSDAAWSRKQVLVEHPTGNLWDAIRYRNSTYVEYDEGSKEYYDLTTDPYQLNNSPSLAPTDAPTLLAALKTCQGAECRRLEE